MKVKTAPEKNISTKEGNVDGSRTLEVMEEKSEGAGSKPGRKGKQQGANSGKSVTEANIEE